MIKAVVFDFGGVMTSTTMPERVHEVVLKKGLPWQKVVELFGKYRLDYDGGFITLKEMYDKIWADAGVEVSAADRAEIEEADSASWLYRNEKTLKWMRELKSAGYKIGILTNMAPSFAPLFYQHFPDYIELADALVISGLEHVTKPERRIYQLLRERIGLPADELIFIDDVEKNCAGARADGWRAIRFVSNAQVERDFDSCAY